METSLSSQSQRRLSDFSKTFSSSELEIVDTLTEGHFGPCLCQARCSQFDSFIMFKVSKKRHLKTQIDVLSSVKGHISIVQILGKGKHLADITSG